MAGYFQFCWYSCVCILDFEFFYDVSSVGHQIYWRLHISVLITLHKDNGEAAKRSVLKFCIRMVWEKLSLPWGHVLAQLVLKKGFTSSTHCSFCVGFRGNLPYVVKVLKTSINFFPKFNKSNLTDHAISSSHPDSPHVLYTVYCIAGEGCKFISGSTYGDY
jgi:hypothetical protein